MFFFFIDIDGKVTFARATDLKGRMVRGLHLWKFMISFRFDSGRLPFIFHCIRIYLTYIVAQWKNLRLFPLYGNIRVRENPYSGIFYAVVDNLSFCFNNLILARKKLNVWEALHDLVSYVHFKKTCKTPMEEWYF